MLYIKAIGLAIIFLVTLGLVLRLVIGQKDSRRLRASKGDTEALPEATDSIKVVATNGTKRKYDCGHTGPRGFLVDFWGSREINTEDSRICPDCLIQIAGDGTIRCFDCHLPIYKGNPVNLWIKDFREKQRDGTVVINGQKICCLRWSCATTMAAFAGYWNGEGIDYLYPSLNSVGAEVFATGEPQSASIR